MLKGHVQIELHNHKTGSRERIEQDNLVTNAVDMLSNFVIGKGGVATNNIMPIMSRALGGLMIFKDPLTESANNVGFPYGNDLVAYAGQSLDTTEPERGSINNLESGPVENGYMTVWDFSTSQANGLISSMARTHYQVDSTLPFIAVASMSDTGVGGNVSFVEFDIPNREVEYFYKASGASVWTLYKRDLPISNYSVTDTAAAGYGNPELIDDVTFTTSISGNTWYKDNGNYYSIKSISKSSRLNDPVVITLLEYSSSTYQKVNEYTFSITTSSAAAAFGTPNLGVGSSIVLSDGILFVPEFKSSTEMLYYIFDLEDGTTQSKSSDQDAYIFNNQPDLLINLNTTQFIPGTNKTWLLWFKASDIVSNAGYLVIIKSDGTYKRYTRLVSILNDNRPQIYNGIFTIGLGASQQIRACANYLGTICNLEAPFEKTSTTSMKVKYTLVNT